MSTAVSIAQPVSGNPYAPNPNLKIWLGHELVPVSEAKVSVFDHGLLYGDGVFEGIRIYNGKIFKEQAHIKRLYHSARAIRLDIPVTPDQVSHAMHESMKANGIEGDGYIRLLVTRGVGLLGLSIGHTANPTVVVIADRIQLYPPEVYARGLHCIFSSLARNHPNTTSPRVKSLNYLNNIMAKAEAKDAGADEAILLTIDGHISECTGDNIFLVRDGAVFTPPTSEGILEGITRGLVIELMRKRKLHVEEKSLIRHDVYVADEIFATGTAAEVIPITEVDRRPVADGNPGPITTQLIGDFVAYRNSV